MSSKAVILGGTGFLGSVARRHLTSSGIPTCSFGSRQINLLRGEEFGCLEKHVGSDTILIYASAITRERGDSSSAYDANLSMVRNTIQFLQSQRVGRVIYLSSASVYGRRRSDLAISEETPPDLDSFYAQAKYDGEQEFRKAGIPLAVLRLCQVYGPGDTHRTYGPMRFVTEVLEKNSLTLFGKGEELRDHLYSEDFGRLMVRILSSGAEGVYNVAPGVPHTFREIAECLTRIAPMAFEIRCASRRVPLVHQGLDVGRLRRVVPDAGYTLIEKGLKSTFEALSDPVA